MKQEEKLNTSETSVYGIDNNDYGNRTEVAEFESVENTPFTIAKQNGKYYALLGNYMVAEPYNTKKEILEIIKKKDWQLLMAVISVMIETIEKNKQNKENK